MLTRICLIVVIVAGLAALGISHFKLAEKITTITKDRDDNAKERDKNATDRDQAREAEKTAKTELTTTQTELAATKTQLAEATSKATEAENRATKFAGDLTKATKERDDARQKLSGWEDLGKPLATVKTTLAQFARVKEERDAFEEEKKILTRTIQKLEFRLAQLLDEAPKVEMPGVKGKIISVDPKYEFVVLDIGVNQGAKEYGELLINRKGRLVGKVRILSVEPDRSIANIIPSWKQDEPFEGDEVLY